MKIILTDLTRDKQFNRLRVQFNELYESETNLLHNNTTVFIFFVQVSYVCTLVSDISANSHYNQLPLIASLKWIFILLERLANRTTYLIKNMKKKR